MFSKNLVRKLPKYLNINKNSIKLKIDKQPLYKSIYSLEKVELETFKTYIKLN